MTLFAIRGPFEMSYEARRGGRTLVFDDFWSEDSPAYELADACGCYVFAIRTRGLKPLYVGKTTSTFKRETFNPTNKHKYHDGFSRHGKGTPVMFFVVHPSQRGRKNEKEIEEIETFLIQAGVARNPKLQNVRGAQTPEWQIEGVVRNRKRRRKKAENDFRRLFDLADE